MPTVKEIARERDEVVTVTPDETAVEVAETMKEENVGSVIVVEDETPVGIVTDRDLAMQIIAGDREANETETRDVMTRDLVTVDADDEISDLIETLGDAGVRRMPVVDGGEIAGIVTLDDIVVLLATEHQSISNEFQSVRSVITSESPPY
ncbi:MAG: CBS domain-containing protein [Halobacteria archaeon]|nr:CBS domain-containing protein [Halobacteria archaeon]